MVRRRASRPQSMWGLRESLGELDHRMRGRDLKSDAGEARKLGAVAYEWPQPGISLQVSLTCEADTVAT